MVTFLRTLFFFVVFWFHQLLILPLLGYFLIRATRPGDPKVRRQVSWVGRTWGRLLCLLGGAHITVTDRADLREDEAVLFVGNHQGDFDIPILIAFCGRDLAFVAKKELAHVPLVSQWMRLQGCVFLDRDDRRKQVAQIRQTVANLESGLSMVIFPEGTRSRGNDMRPFAKGSLNIAERAGARIVPVTLKDTHTLKPKGSFGLPGGRVEIILHPPIDPKHLSKDEKARLHETVRDIVASGLHSS